MSQNLTSRIEKLIARRDAALVAGQVAFAGQCDREIAKTRQELAMVEADNYERFGYDAR